MLKKGRLLDDNPSQDPDTIHPETAAQYAQRGWANYSIGEFSKSEADFEQAIQMDPENLDYWYGLGLDQKGAGRKQEAVQAFTRVLEMLGTAPVEDRARMIRRLAHGQISEIESGDWNLEKEIWQKKP